MRLFIVVSLMLASIAQAQEYRLELLDKSGHAIDIGALQLDKAGHYQIAIDHSHFRDYFLSMKEMKCLEGPELWCHLAYPYPNKRRVTDQDLRWLSHDLLFMYKRPAEFGANFWQGIYYQLERVDGQFIGRAMAVDLNEIASPPADPDQPYYDEQWMEPVDVQSRWLPTLRIRPVR